MWRGDIILGREKLTTVGWEDEVGNGTWDGVLLGDYDVQVGLSASSPLQQLLELGADHCEGLSGL